MAKFDAILFLKNCNWVALVNVKQGIACEDKLTEPSQTLGYINSCDT